MLITITLLVTSICILISYCWILKSRYEYFKRRTIPGPLPHFFFGHYLTLWNVPSFPRQIYQWTRQFGPIYGLFEGTRPVYVVSDLDFLQEVFIKQFTTFHSRRTNFFTHTLKSKGVNLFTASADQWRRQRHVINPTFTTMKLKTMVPLMNRCIDSMLMKIEEISGDELNIYTLYKRLTMDVICKS